MIELCGSYYQSIDFPPSEAEAEADDGRPEEAVDTIGGEVAVLQISEVPVARSS